MLDFHSINSFLQIAVTLKTESHEKFLNILNEYPLFHAKS